MRPQTRNLIYPTTVSPEEGIKITANIENWCLSFSTTLSRDRVKAARDHHPKNVIFKRLAEWYYELCKENFKLCWFFSRFIIHSTFHSVSSGRREEHTQSLR